MALDGWTAQGIAELTVHRPNNSLSDIIYHTEDTAHQQHVLQQQWVTLTASMWPAEPTEAPSGAGYAVVGGISTERLPLLAAVFCGAALVVCVVFAVIIYRCCLMNRKDKPYCTRKVDVAPSTTPTPGTSNVITSTGHNPYYHHHYYQHHHRPPQHQYYLPPPSINHNSTPTAVYAIKGTVDPSGSSWGGYTNRLLNAADGVAAATRPAWIQQADGSVVPVQCTQCPRLCPSPVPRSSSVPGAAGISKSPITDALRTNSTRRQRPVSQPITVMVSNGEDAHKKPAPMPEISEFSPPSIQYASSSILDEVGTTEDSEGVSSLKTRSLPAWVRSKQRPLSTEDDLNDLYAKVNFSKKRKNRMRNDEAAIIALSKSRSQFLHKDTDSLVDNEAVIVYDERTAL